MKSEEEKEAKSDRAPIQVCRLFALSGASGCNFHKSYQKSFSKLNIIDSTFSF